jgi:ABC-2 type transport system permease protein
VASVATDRAGVAQRVALGATFGLYLIESLLTETEYELLGAVAPMRYFDPSSTLIDGSYDIAGALVLTVMTLFLVALAGVWFVSRDI